MTVNVSCPHCGRTDGIYSVNEYKYGSPIRVCKKCGGKFLNRFYHEIAVDGTEPNAFNIAYDVKRLLIVLVIFIASTAIHAAEIHLSGRYHLSVAFIALISLMGFLFCVFDMIDIKSGNKRKRMDKKYLESVERLRDKEYAKELAEYGYNVPAEFLGEDVHNSKEE